MSPGDPHPDESEPTEEAGDGGPEAASESAADSQHPRRRRRLLRAGALLAGLLLGTVAGLLGFESLTRPGAPAAALGCAVDPASLTAPGCRIVSDDSARSADALSGLWGSIDCEGPRRVGFVTGGGDPAARIDGTAQGNASYRSITVVDGDDFYGERCELGRNESRFGVNRERELGGTFALYQEGERYITAFSQRYGRGFDPQVASWQTVAQMKQAQPADNGDGSPILELQIRDGELRLQNDETTRWASRAPAVGRWIRYVFDVRYSADSETGSLQLFADLNGDGDALDAGERSPALAMATLRTETETTDEATSRDLIRIGEPIPSHLRLGLYHDPVLPCAPPVGCTVDVDNVQVAAAPR